MVEEEIKGEDDKGENISELEYSKKSEFSKANLVQEALVVVKERRSQEMKEGYYNFLPLPNGEVKKIYVPDSRKAYVGSVEYLKSILTPEIKVDVRMKRVLSKFGSKKRNNFNNNSVRRIIFDGDSFLLTKDKYIPEIDDDYPIIIQLTKGGRVTNKEIDNRSGYWNYNVRRYWDEMVLIYDFLFGELNLLLSTKKINYFKQKTGY